MNNESAVKTAISIDRGTWLAADMLATEMSVSRSRLYALALQEFVARHAAMAVKERLDEVYAKGRDEEEEKILQMARTTQRRILEEKK